MKVKSFAQRINHLTFSLWGALCLILVLSFLAPASLFKTGRAAGEPQKSSPATPVTFTNSAPIAINNGAAVPYPSSITVSGLSGVISTIPGSFKVTINGFSHTFPDDVGMVLVGPTGVAFAFQNGAGDNADMVNVTYSIADNGTSRLPEHNIWGQGTYKPANFFANDSFPAPGPGTNYMNPGPDLGGTATFASSFGGTNPNGVWNLFVVDFVSGANGSISGGWSLTIDTNPPPEVHRAVLDFDGDGKTDYAVTRDTSGSRVWYLQQSTAGFSGTSWGLADDSNVPGDYDGDGKWDIAVFRNGSFYILRSLDGTLQTVSHGQAGDNPHNTQDFDGDGRVDPTVTRNTNGTLTWLILRSTLGLATVPFGNAATDVGIRGDFDGDGLADWAVYRNAAGTPANSFIAHRSSAFGQTTTTVFGVRTSDNIIPADFDGDGKTDVAVWRGVGAGSSGTWYWLNSSNGAFNAFNFGVGNLDLPVPGDFDGDGKTDQAVWRPTNGTFYVNGSVSGFSSFPFGAMGDNAVGYFLQVR